MAFLRNVLSSRKQAKPFVFSVTFLMLALLSHFMDENTEAQRCLVLGVQHPANHCSRISSVSEFFL